jgi:hypothetical protein
MLGRGTVTTPTSWGLRADRNKKRASKGEERLVFRVLDWRLVVWEEYRMFSRANPYLTLRMRQAIAHVTTRRSAHPRFTSTSHGLTGLNCALSTASFTRLTWVYSSPVARPLRASTPSEKDSGEPVLAPGGRNGLLVSESSILHHPGPGTEFQYCCRRGVGILLYNALYGRGLTKVMTTPWFCHY